MRDFARLYTALDETTATGEKVAALAEYFRIAPPGDAAWAVHFLIGDQELHQMPREKVGPDCVAGVRLGPGLSVQVTKLEVKKFP